MEKKLNVKYEVMAKYLGNNKLKLNDDKTHLLIMTTKHKRRLMNIQTAIFTDQEEIKPIKTEKLLGIHPG